MKEALEVQGLDALLVAGRKLQESDPDAFARLLAAARALVAVHERPDEPEPIFASRIAQIRSRGPRRLD
jgi:hypothetical protein